MMLIIMLKLLGSFSRSTVYYF